MWVLGGVVEGGNLVARKSEESSDDELAAVRGWGKWVVEGE